MDSITSNYVWVDLRKSSPTRASAPPELQENTVATSSSNPFRILGRHRHFRIFWIGQTLSLVGSWMQTMAVGWLSLQLSNSAFVVGLVASIGALPIVLFSMHAGALVDRGDRARQSARG